MSIAVAAGLLSLAVGLPVSAAVLIATIGAVHSRDRDRRRTAVEALRILVRRGQ
ncbi:MULTISPECIES: hypothetical protein [Nocardia]|uniref:hypothetical protein n=1 Tax=Nocardia TaxID=1817 RepID=UPI002453DAF6|nr:hypothetical protein [Nocardia farcinica]